jgi:hypothetical protein
MEAIEAQLFGAHIASESCDTSGVGAAVCPGRFCHKTLKLYKIFRPVTAEAAGSSPVSRAILANRIRHLSNPRFRGSAAAVAALRLRSLFDRHFVDVQMIG